MLIISPTRVIRFGAMDYITFEQGLGKTYHGDQLDEELPPVIENIVHEGVATGYILVGLQIFETFFRNVAHI